MSATPADRPRAGRRHSSPGGWRALAALLLVTSVPLLAPTRPAAAATTCRSIGGVPAPSGGDHHATVVVDTGSGPVWSACISFSGTITGVQALGLASDLIPDLAPVYDTYTGVGRAVCQLRGVGNDPPGCLGKTAAYWAYSRNGRYSSVGAGAVEVSEGDIEGWRWGTGSGAPRGATIGSEATRTTVPPTRPPSTTPPSGTQPSGPSAPGATVPSSRSGAGTPAPPTAPGAPGTSPNGSSTAPPSGDASATTAPAGAPTTTILVASGPGASKAPAGVTGDRRRSTAGEEAGVARRSGGGPTDTGSGRATGDSGSNVASVVGFAAILLVAGGAAVVLRRRRPAAF